MNEKTENYKIIDGDLVWINPELKEFTIPEGVIVVSLKEEPCCDKKLERVIFSSTVKYVGNRAFAYFGLLKELKLNKELEGIGYNAFLRTNISTLTIPCTNLTISGGAFDESKTEKLIIENDASVYFGRPYMISGDYVFHGNFDIENHSCLSDVTLPISYKHWDTLMNEFSDTAPITINLDVQDGNNIENFDLSELHNLKELNFTFDNSKSIVDAIYQGKLLKIIDSITKNDVKINFKSNFETKSEDEDEWYKALNEIYNKCYDSVNPHILFSLIIKQALMVTKEKVENVKKQIESGKIPRNTLSADEQYEKDILKLVIFEVSRYIEEKEKISEVLSNIYYLSPKYNEMVSGLSVYESIKELYKVFEKSISVLATIDIEECNYKGQYIDLMSAYCSGYIDRVLFTNEASSGVFKEFINDAANHISGIIEAIYTSKKKIEQDKCDVAKKRALKYLEDNK